MSKREWKLYIEDILESIELIEKYINDIRYEEFINNKKQLMQL